MKKDSKNPKAPKNKSVFTLFGERLQNALTEFGHSASNKKSQNKSEETQKNVSKPLTPPNQPSQNLDSSRRKENIQPLKNVQESAGDRNTRPNFEPSKLDKSPNNIPAVNQMRAVPIPVHQTGSKNKSLPVNSAAKIAPQTAGTQTGFSQQFTKLMREKFWENLDGEAPSGHRGRPLRINLGIDLGTSFSKVVYRLGGESYPVRFGEGKNNIEDYLVPSVVAVNSKGIKCRFEIKDEEKLKKAVQLPNFKICLTCEHNGEPTGCKITKCDLSNLKQGYLPSTIADEEASFLTAFYLAKLIARTKQEVRRQLPEREIPSDINIKWSANLAVPDRYLDSRVVEGFRQALEIGWLMAEIFLSRPELSLKDEIANCYVNAQKLHAEIKGELFNQGKDFDCFTYSEIGAEVASVTLSPTSEEGLYVLVDVGAGTVDTSVFRFRRSDGEPLQETYAADIFKLGAAQIDSRANRNFAKKSIVWLRQIKENVFRHSAEEALIHITEEIKSAEESVVSDLKDKLIGVYREAFSKQKDVNVWSKLKLVMGGGGSAIGSYGASARAAFSPKVPGIPEIEFSTLKVPSDFQMETLPVNQFHRFAVAYGLSRDRIELPEIFAAHQISPMETLRQKIYVDPTNDG